MKRTGVALAFLVALLGLGSAVKAQTAELLQQLEAARTPTEALPLLERLGRALSEGNCSAKRCALPA